MMYPDRFLRGISNPSFVDAGGRASGEIFQFDNTGREDGFFESSINWYDDADALTVLMEQRKKNDAQSFQFRYGVAVIERYEADRIIKNELYASVFRYERAKIDGNPYHGNLLRKDGSLEKRIYNMIAACLAMNAQLILRSTDKCGEDATDDEL